MKKQPTIETARLLLRPFSMNDAPDIKKFAGNREIASTTTNIPHPYEDGMAEEWIGTHWENFEAGKEVNYAIVFRENKSLIGAMGLMNISREHEKAELGYWIGKPCWGQGYCTEAGHAVLGYAFNVLDLNRIYATHFRRNPASGSVMRKLGMKHEGSLRQHVRKWDKFEDMEINGILKTEYRYF